MVAVVESLIRDQHYALLLMLHYKASFQTWNGVKVQCSVGGKLGELDDGLAIGRSRGKHQVQRSSVFNLSLSPNSDVLPIIINASDTIIQCGPDGSKISTCVVLGGSRQFEIAGSVSGIELKGLTFFSATNVSVGTLGSYNASATFDD
eukprot:12011123-Ditylum_brightwellii.AAC.1